MPISTGPAVPPLTDEEREMLSALRDERTRGAGGAAPARPREAEDARLRQAEADRQARLLAFEADRARRIEEAERRRKAEAEARDAARIARAAERIGGLESLEEARRRLAAQGRRAAALAVLRLLVMVALPAAAAAWYYAAVATPMYRASTIFAVNLPSAAPEPAAAGQIPSDPALRQAYLVQAFVLSPELMDRMEQSHGLLSHFDGAELGIIASLRARLGYPLSGEEVYARAVQVTTDPREGLVTLEVLARSPAEAEAFSARILDYAEAHGTALTAAVSRRQLATLSDEVARSHAALIDARRLMADLQLSSGEPDPAASAAAIYAIIGDLERQAAEERRTLAAALASRGPVSPVVQHQREQVAVVERAIAEQRDRLTGRGTGAGMAGLVAELEYARIDVDLAQKSWEAKLNALEDLRQKLAGADMSFSLVSQPSAPARAAAPEPVRGTALVFIAALVLHVMASVFGASFLRLGRD
jgi:capsular polysaccharide transport system permease protein